jgi:hypothetical protein
MGTSEEISRRYPKEIELDARAAPPGRSFYVSGLADNPRVTSRFRCG